MKRQRETEDRPPEEVTMASHEEGAHAPPGAGSSPRPRRRRALATALAVAALVVAAFLLGRGSGPHSAHDHDHELPPATQGQERLYTCSMHPQVRTTDPRERCPLCGMELIPVPSSDDGDDDASLPRLSVSPRSAALMRLETTPVERRPVTTSLHLYGTVAVDESRVRHIAAWVPGRLERLFVDTTGVEVRSGEPMAVVYSPLLVAAQQELLQSLAAVRQLPAGVAPSHRASAEALAAASRDKLRLLGVSDELADEVVRRGEVEDRLTLTAPVSGVVTAREATEGMYVRTGDRVYSVADLAHLWVNLEVHEREVAWLEVGQPVTFTVRALPGESFRATVAFVQPVVTEPARTVQVRLHLPNPQRRLKPGMLVTGEVRVAAAEAPPLVIPATAPLITGRRAVVYVQLGDPAHPVYEGREVVLGRRAGDHWVVEEGLAEGELVVSRGAFKVDSELQIRGRPSMMAPAGGAATGHGHGHEAAASWPSPAAEQPARADRVRGASALGERLAAVVRANFALVEGLSDDDPAAARRAAEAALTTLAEADRAVLDGSARDLWRPLSERMRGGLSALLEQRELDQMRPHFEVFSDALTEAVRRFGAASRVTVYRAMCPMVQGREAYWLQADRAVTNPYHGARMYSCGAVVETLVEVGDHGR